MSQPKFHLHEFKCQRIKRLSFYFGMNMRVWCLSNTLDLVKSPQTLNDHTYSPIKLYMKYSLNKLIVVMLVSSWHKSHYDLINSPLQKSLALYSLVVVAPIANLSVFNSHMQLLNMRSSTRCKEGWGHNLIIVNNRKSIWWLLYWHESTLACKAHGYKMPISLRFNTKVKGVYIEGT